ncbi:hypothetical protein CAC42_590 [Sphaceloma murrayae]|uniref:Uncharacterized protein n=1 Tax=Sphaceloma murrayae TaxID=2082308 RepID=A0A2K1R3X3_9PEZI|nr:hypothetical protein CAC42_590 [Sphaceloma murrayae]
MTSTAGDLWNLYDGAITFRLPPGFQQLSDMLDAADTQEIFKHADENVSVIVDLCATVSTDVLVDLDGSPNDELAPLRYHLADLTRQDRAEDGASQTEVEPAVRLSSGIGSRYSTYSATVKLTYPPSTTPVSSPARPAPGRTFITIILVRYTFPSEPARDTDIVITVSSRFSAVDAGLEAHVVGAEYDGRTALGAKACERIVDSLTIVDEGLFAEQE